MRKCPHCGQTFSDDNIFCVNDGTTLVFVSDVVSNRVVVPVGDDRPTEVVQRPNLPPPPHAQPRPSNSGLYVVIGILIAVVLALGGGLLFLRNQNDRAANTGQNSGEKKEGNTSSFAQKENPTPTPVSVNAMVNAVNANPAGTKPFSDGSSNKADTSMPYRFNRSYEGTVNYDPIEMQLVRNGTSLSGKVIPKNRYADISVSGNIDDDGSFEMTEYSDLGAITGKYQGRIQANNTITGSWSKPDGSKSRPIYLKAQ